MQGSKETEKEVLETTRQRGRGSYLERVNADLWGSTTVNNKKGCKQKMDPMPMIGSVSCLFEVAHIHDSPDGFGRILTQEICILYNYI